MYSKRVLRNLTVAQLFFNCQIPNHFTSRFELSLIEPFSILWQNPKEMDKEIAIPSVWEKLVSPTEPEFPRGISPQILLTHVKNTAPFIFNEALSSAPQQSYLKILRHTDAWLKKFPEAELNHATYFELCVSAHWGTVATFVPTDVDNQIRSRLWHPGLPLDVLFAMVDVVEQALTWDASPVSARGVKSPITHDYLSGHHGEWFSISVAAYGALRKRHPERAQALSEMILKELDRELSIFNQFREVRDGIGALKAATVIAHNAGDLVRVMELWNFDPNDFLRTEFAKRESPSHLKGAFPTLSHLNRQYMAIENHRNFALRKPKCLRSHASLLIPLGPFFDDWGKQIAQSPHLDEFDLGSIVEALVDGWIYLKDPIGYARALAGMEIGIQGGLSRLCKLVPSKMAKQLSSGKLRTLTSISQSRFESQWNQFGLK